MEIAPPNYKETRLTLRQTRSFMPTIFGIMFAVSVAFIPKVSCADDEVFDDTRGDVSVDQDALDSAEDLFFKGLTAYQMKRYSESASLFLKAHKLVPFRDLLFNIARSYEEAKNKTEAVRYYKLYIKTKPIDETLIIRRVRELGDTDFMRSEKSDVQNKVEPDPDLAPPVLSDSSSSLPHDALTWSTLGGGVALIAVSAYFGIDALSQAESARDASTPKTYEKFKDSAESSALFADISLAVGVVALAGGVFLWMNEVPAEAMVLHQDLGVSARTSRRGTREARAVREMRSRQVPVHDLSWRVHVDQDMTTLGFSGRF